MARGPGKRSQCPSRCTNSASPGPQSFPTCWRTLKPPPRVLARRIIRQSGSSTHESRAGTPEGSSIDFVRSNHQIRATGRPSAHRGTRGVCAILVFRIHFHDTTHSSPNLSYLSRLEIFRIHRLAMREDRLGLGDICASSIIQVAPSSWPTKGIELLSHQELVALVSIAATAGAVAEFAPQFVKRETALENDYQEQLSAIPVAKKRRRAT